MRRTVKNIGIYEQDISMFGNSLWNYSGDAIGRSPIPDGYGTADRFDNTKTGKWKDGKKNGIFIEAGFFPIATSFTLALYRNDLKVDALCFQAPPHNHYIAESNHNMIKRSIERLEVDDAGEALYYETKAALIKEQLSFGVPIVEYVPKEAKQEDAADAAENQRQREKQKLQQKLSDIEGGYAWKHRYNFFDDAEKEREKQRLSSQIDELDKRKDDCCVM